MNNLFSIRVKCIAGNSSGIYIKTNVIDYDLVLFSYHSIVNKEGKPEDYKLYYYDGTSEKIEVIEEKKYTKEDGDLVIAKVKKLENRFRSKIEDTFFEGSKEGEKLLLRGFPQKKSTSESPFQKLEIKVNDLDVNEKFHEFEFISKNGSLPNKDDTHGMSGSPVFKMGKSYIKLKGMYLEIGEKKNTFGMGHFLKSEKIKECLEAYCPEYDFGITEVLSQKICKVIDEIKKEVLEYFGEYSEEDDAWNNRFKKLKNIIVRNKEIIRKIVDKITCGNYKTIDFLDDENESKTFVRCLLSAMVCNDFNMDEDCFLNYDNEYTYLSPSLNPKYPKVEIAKLMKFLKENGTYNERKIFLRYNLARGRCSTCILKEEDIEAINSDVTLLESDHPEHFMRFSTRTNVKIKCSTCFVDIMSTMEYEKGGKWGKNKRLEESN